MPGICCVRPMAPAAASPYLPKGIKEPDPVYEARIQHARPSGFFRDALRTYAGMLSFLHWRALPPSLQRVIGDVDGMGTDLAVLLFIADLLVLRDGGCLVVVVPPAQLFPSEGHRLEAVARGDRGALPRLMLAPRADLLHWRLSIGSRELLEFTLRSDERRPLRPLQYGATPVLMVGPNGEILSQPAVDDWLYTTYRLRAGRLLGAHPGRPAFQLPSQRLPVGSAGAAAGARRTHPLAGDLVRRRWRPVRRG